MTEEKKQNFFWPDVSTVDSAKKAANYGVGAGVFVAVVTAGFATWALMSHSRVAGFIDAWAYVDAVLFGAIALGIYKESRFAAVAGLSLFVVEKAFQVQASGKFDGAVMAVFIAIFFISSVRGTFALRRLRAEGGGQQGAPGDGPRPAGSDRA